MSNVVNDKQVGFVQGTAVLMANGSLKPIEKIVPGDWVMSFNQNDAASELEPMQVIDTFSYISRDIIEVKADDNAVMVARGQLFLTPSADWHFATDTAYITDIDGNAKSFTVDMINTGKHKVYDIIVDENHSLVANGFRVHNGEDRPAGPGGGGGVGGAIGSAVAGAVKGAATAAMGGGGLGAIGRGAAQGALNSVSSKLGGGLNKSVGGLGGGGNSNRTSSSSNNGRAGSGSSTGRAGGGAGGQNSGVGTNGGNGQNAAYLKNTAEKSAKKTKGSNKPKADPPPAPEAMAYAALDSLQRYMDYICDLMQAYSETNFNTVKTSAIQYTSYADALANDSFLRMNTSKKVSRADKEAFRQHVNEIIARQSYIRQLYNDYANNVAALIGPVISVCNDVRKYVDRAKGLLGKYVGTGKSVIDYSLPGAPAPVDIPVKISTLTDTQYVQTTPGLYATTAPSATGGLTGGLGAAYYRYRVVRGFLYGYNKNSGWVKVGPADQWEGLY